MDWSICLQDEKKLNDEKRVWLGHIGMINDTFTCQVDRKAGEIKFRHNGSKIDWFTKFTDEEIKKVYSISLFLVDRWVNLFQSLIK